MYGSGRACARAVPLSRHIEPAYRLPRLARARRAPSQTGGASTCSGAATAPQRPRRTIRNHIQLSHTADLPPRHSTESAPLMSALGDDPRAGNRPATCGAHRMPLKATPARAFDRRCWSCTGGACFTGQAFSRAREGAGDAPARSAASRRNQDAAALPTTRTTT